MARQFDLIVFDWDGTLFDSAGAIVQSLRQACRDLGLPEPPESRARHVIGLALPEALRHVAPDLAADCFPALIERYRYHYLSADQEIKLFEGVREMIETLHASGVSLAVATGKSRKGLDRAFVNTALGPYFVSSRCADECFSKPHPQMLEELMEECNVENSRTLMIGDTTHDLLMAINARVAGLAVSYGAHPEDSLRGLDPVTCVDSVERLHQWLVLNA